MSEKIDLVGPRRQADGRKEARGLDPETAAQVQEKMAARWRQLADLVNSPDGLKAGADLWLVESGAEQRAQSVNAKLASIRWDSDDRSAVKPGAAS